MRARAAGSKIGSILASIADRASIRSFSVGDWAGLNGLGGEAEELATRAYAPEPLTTPPFGKGPRFCYVQPPVGQLRSKLRATALSRLKLTTRSFEAFNFARDSETPVKGRAAPWWRRAATG